ncbi:MAG: hypothetical protein AAF515_08410 [Pseudomonadota bacterium]
MPVMTATIYGKGEVFRALDAFFAQPDVPYADLIAEFSKKNSKVATILRNYKIITRVQQKHIEDDWFGNEPPAYWPLIKNKEEIVKQAAVRALKLAGAKKNNPLPIVSAWLCTGNQFQGIVEACPNQINLFIATPPPPMNDDLEKIDEDVWVTASDGAIADMREPFVKHWGGNKETPPKLQKKMFKGVQEVRLKG